MEKSKEILIPTTLLIEYSARFGSTFDSFFIDDPEVARVALEQMKACLAGARKAPVTNESIGLVQGEGVTE
jgi:hypothetical protein